MLSDSLSKLRDPFYLPTLAELKLAFPLDKSFPTDSKEFPYVSPEFTHFQHIIHRYQVYTVEFIESLARYLSSRKLKTIEVGAGDGRLTFFLKKYLDASISITATDSKEWEDSGETNTSVDVEKLSYKEALEKYATEPILIISCWMNIDLKGTSDFRASSHVKEYLLIGDIFRTGWYGQEWYLPENSNFSCMKLTRASDGSRNGIVNGSIGRFDGSPHNPESRTEVYSFRRVE